MQTIQLTLEEDLLAVTDRVAQQQLFNTGDSICGRVGQRPPSIIAAQRA